MRSTEMVAAAAGIDDVELIRSVLDELGHVPQIVGGAAMWVLDDVEMEAIAAAVDGAVFDDDDDDDDDDDGDDGDDDDGRGSEEA